ncbi:MAG: MarR family winged helix-turn-helix transcriptional regulator [Acidimicrobiales bacterium]
MARPTKSGKEPQAPNTVNRHELLVDGSDFEFRQFVHDSLGFATRLLAVRDGFAKLLGVSGPQYTILISVAHLAERGPVTVSGIANHLHLSGSFVTTESNKLAKLGLLSKVTDEEDRRRVLLEVTDDGDRRLHELAEVQADVNDVHFGCLDDASFDRVRAIMPELVVSTDQALSLLDHLTTMRSSA